MDELLRDFLTETTEHIEGAETQLVHFERNPSDASLIASIFRLVHTIKGTSSFLGLERLERVGHAAESVMGMLRDGVPPTQHSVTLILAAIDRIKNDHRGYRQARQSEPPADDSEIITALEAYYAAGSEAAAAAAAADASATADAPATGSALQKRRPSSSPSLPLRAAPAATVEHPAARSTEGEVRRRSARAGKEQASGTGRRTATGKPIRVSVDTIERMMQLVSELVL